MSNGYPTLKMNLFELIRLGPDQTHCIMTQPDKASTRPCLHRKLEIIILNFILSMNIFNGNVLIS